MFSITILALLATGCFGANKATGGGWFIDTDTGNYVTVGFNGQYVGEQYLDPELGWIRDAKGQFQFTDHTLGMVIHGKFLYTSIDLETTDNSAFIGECTIDGVGSYMFGVMVDDEYIDPVTEEFFEDVNYLLLTIDMDDSGTFEKETADMFYQGFLGGGAIRIHVAE